MGYELRQYSFGATIGKGFNLYFTNFIQILLISVLCKIPMAISIMFWNQSHFTVGTGAVAILAMIMSAITKAILSAFIIYLVSKNFLEGDTLSLVKGPPSILPLVFPIIGLSIVIGLITVLGSLACVIPGIIFGLGYSIATIVLVLERKGISESMKRSWELTKGRKGEIFGVALISHIIIACIQFPLIMTSELLSMSEELMSYIQLGASALVEPIWACILVVIYFNLRIEKEGFNIEHLTEQFSLAGEYGSSLDS